jgi:hypothetical protein
MTDNRRLFCFSFYLFFRPAEKLGVTEGEDYVEQNEDLAVAGWWRVVPSIDSYLVGDILDPGEEALLEREGRRPGKLVDLGGRDIQYPGKS